LTRKRLDEELVSRGLVTDTPTAQHIIDDHRVLIDDSFAFNYATRVSPKSNIKLLPPEGRFVSRGGHKLQGALEDLNIEVSGKRCLDAGAGTGGFTDCLLQNGAASVTAVDVGYGQFDWKVRSDAKVRVIERTNIRTADPQSLGGPYDLVVADLSFISLDAVASNLSELVAADGDLLALVKPQFEAEREDVGRRGVVTNPRVWGAALSKAADSFERRGLAVCEVVPSRLKGAEGNQEFFVLLKREGDSDSQKLIDDALAKVNS
jgi:23S rRNA (cytidine1920-2'-O)/16S rRNA (cytidine1409-2'-O)-methyltransferase